MAEIQTIVTNAATDAMMSEVVGKKWYASRTFWVNVVAAGALLLQMRYGFIIDSNMQALLLTFINLFLRKITKEPIVF